MWPDAAQLVARDGVALGQCWQDRLAVLELGVGVVGTLDVRAEVARELDGAPAGVEHHRLAVARRRPQAEAHAPDPRIGHLRRHRALPNEVVEAVLVAAVQLAPEVVRGPHPLARRADRFVGLLRVLHLAAVLAWLRRKVIVAVERADLAARRLHGLR